MSSFSPRLILIICSLAFGFSYSNAQTERCDSLIGDWLLTKVYYKFSKEPIVFPEKYQDFISIDKSGNNYDLVVKTSDFGPILSSFPTSDPNLLIRGVGGIRNIGIISIQPNEVTFSGEKDGRKCTATLLRKPN